MYESIIYNYSYCRRCRYKMTDISNSSRFATTVFCTTASGGMMYTPTACMMCILLALVAKYIKNAWQNCQAFFGAPRGARIPNLWFRRPTLYPIELVAHISACFIIVSLNRIVNYFRAKLTTFLNTEL